MSQDIVEKKAQPITDLTEMQRRFCDYLIFNEGRTTHQDAALHAGYSPKRAAVEASELLRNPKIQTYIAKRSADVNRSFAVTKHNYVKRQQVLSQRIVDDNKIKDCELTEKDYHKVSNKKYAYVCKMIRFRENALYMTEHTINWYFIANNSEI